VVDENARHGDSNFKSDLAEGYPACSIPMARSLSGVDRQLELICCVGNGDAATAGRKDRQLKRQAAPTCRAGRPAWPDGAFAFLRK
jgi:hypothetical protein